MKLYKRTLPMKGKVVYGFYTGDSTKKEIIGYIHEGLENGLTLHGKQLCDEMNKFIEDASGRMGASTIRRKSTPGAATEMPQDGRVIGLGLACCGWFKWKQRPRWSILHS